MTKLGWRQFIQQFIVVELDEVLFGLANCQRVILIVHLRLDMIACANGSCHPGGCIGMQTHSITVILLNEIGTGFNAHHFALDGVAAIQVQTQAQQAPTRHDPDHFENRDDGCLLG